MPYSGSVMTSPCSIPQAYDYPTRLANAQLVNKKLCNTAEPISDDTYFLIDDVTPHNSTGNNPVWCSYGQGPNMGFVIAQNGTVVLEQQWLAGGVQADGNLEAVFTAVNNLVGTKECLDQCSLLGNKALCSNQTCSELVKKYPCAEHYAPGKDYAGWCDKTCGYGACSA